MGTTNSAAIITTHPRVAQRDPLALTTWLRKEATAFFLTCDSSEDVSLAEFREWADVPAYLSDATVLREVMAARGALDTHCPTCDGGGGDGYGFACERRLCSDGTLDYPRVTL